MIQIKRFFTVFLILAFTVGLAVGPSVFAKSKDNDNRNSLRKTATEGDYTQFDGNRIASYVSNDGEYVNPWITGQSGMEWPKGSGNTIDFAAGFWIIGLDDSGHVRSASVDYSSEYKPGLILPDGTPDDPEKEEYRIYKINSDGTGDWDSWPYDQGAPYTMDENNNKVPGLIGDQMLYYVINDANPDEHANLFSTQPMGIEVHNTIFGFDRGDAIGDIMFIKWTIINKSDIDYDSVYFSAWSDPDMGDATDDLVGCDTLLSLGFCYNGLPVDATYGSAPPAIGFDFFQGPEVDGEYLPMSSFVYYWNGAPKPYADPEDAEEAYNFQKGFASDGSNYLDPDDNPNPFVFSGDPVSGLGWLDSSPGDRRQAISSGPFTLASGDTQVIVGAKIIAQGSSRLSSVAALKYADQFAQNAFDNDFDIVNPIAPKLTGEALDQKVVLTWDVPSQNQIVESYEKLGYKFEGYNIYQGESQTGPWKLVYTYDIENENAVIYDDVFDATSGWVVNAPTAYGSNTGLVRHYTFDQDWITGYPLYNYKVYYFAVAPYTVNLDAFPKVIEGGISEDKGNMVAISPGNRADEDVAEVEPGSTIEVEHILGLRTTNVTVQAVNPGDFTGHTYEISFEDQISGGDTSVVWDLVDNQTGSTLLNNFPLYTGEEPAQQGIDDPQVVDGFKIYILQQPALGCGGVAFDLPGTVDKPWIAGVSAGGDWWGGVFYGENFFGSTLTWDQSIPIELRFAGDTTSGPENGWASRGYIYRRDLGYAFAGIGYLPFSAWDMSDPSHPRQLNVCFLETATQGNVNFRWDLGGWDGSAWADDATGGREYTFIMNSDYDPDGAIYNDDNWGVGADVVYALWVTGGSGKKYLHYPFTMSFVMNNELTPADGYTFVPQGPKTGTAVTKNNLAKINVVPNPYWAFNSAETRPSGRIIRFTNLPGDKTTIRIFDLAGNLVRVIDDEARAAQGTDGTAYAEWDVRNMADVPVASGIYLVHIEVEGVGEKILKCAVINREERLLYY